MLGRVSQATLERAAADPATWRCTGSACEAYRRPRAQGARTAGDGKLIAYFSAEYGLTECLPVYSGGLGNPVRRPFEVVQRSGLPAASGSACSTSRAISGSC